MQNPVSGPLTEVCSRISHWLARLCLGIGGSCLIFMVMISLANIVTRYLFKLSEGTFIWTIKGANELVACALLLALLAAMAACVERAQVVVDVFTHPFPEPVKRRIEAFFLLGYGGLGGVFALGLWQAAGEARAYGETMQVLPWPVWPVYGLAAGLCAILSLRAVLQAGLGVSGSCGVSDEQ